MRTVELDDLNATLGRVLVSGAPAANIPEACCDEFCVFETFYLEKNRPAIVFAFKLDDAAIEACRSGNAVLVVTKPLVREVEKLGLPIEGYLLYATETFWRKLAACTRVIERAKNIVEEIQKLFKGHIAAIRVLGDIYSYNDVLLGTLQDPSAIYMYYGVPKKIAEFITRINIQLLRRNLEPLRIEAPERVIKALYTLHPRAVHVEAPTTAVIDTLF